MEFGHNWDSGWHFLWCFFSSPKLHSCVIWTQRLCVFHFNVTSSLRTSSTDPVWKTCDSVSPKFIVPGTTNRLKNRRFGESKNSSFQGPPRVPNGSEATDCFSLLWKKIQPVGSVFFVAALLLFRFAFQQSGVFLAVATLLVFDLQVRGGVGKADSESDFINGLNLQMWISPLNLLGYHWLERKMTQFPTMIHPFDSICNGSFNRLSRTKQANYRHFRNTFEGIVGRLPGKKCEQLQQGTGEVELERKICLWDQNSTWNT